MKKASQIRNRRGFTMIEILTVIAIISVLATIAMVAVSSVRKKARDARRITDIENLEKALRSYRDTASGTALRYPGYDNTGCGGLDLEWYRTDDGLSFIDELVTEGFYSEVPVDPLCDPSSTNPFDVCCGYAYYRAPMSVCQPGASGNFIWLGIERFEATDTVPTPTGLPPFPGPAMVDLHPDNPGFTFDCPQTGGVARNLRSGFVGTFDYFIALPEDF